MTVLALTGVTLASLVLAAPRGRACLQPDEGAVLAGALQEPAIRARCSRWAGMDVLGEALRAGDAGRALGRAFRDLSVHTALLPCLDEAVGAMAERARPGDPRKAALQLGVSTPVVCMLSAEAAAGSCAAFVALAKLMEGADGALAEGLDEEFYRLFTASPGQVVKCWSAIEPYSASIHLETTPFCWRKERVLSLYSGKGGAAAFLQSRARECGKVD